MSRQTIHWSKHQMHGPEVIHTLPGVISGALDGRTPLSATVMTLTLVVKDGDQGYWQAVAQRLAERHPARILLVSSSSDPDSEGIDIDLHATVNESTHSARPPILISECVSMTLHGPAATYWIDWLQPLIRSNLPSYLWWTNGPPPERFRWDLVKTAFQSLIIDSGAFSLPTWHRLIEAAMTYGLEVRDLDWMRSEPVRLLLAQAADDDRALEILKHPDHILVTGPIEDPWPCATTWLWLSGRLHWELGLPPFRDRSTIPVEYHHEDHPVWQFTRNDARLVLTETHQERAAHLVIKDRVQRDWHASRSAEGPISNLSLLLNSGSDALYRDTIRRVLLERKDS